MIRYTLPDQATIPAQGVPWHFLKYALQRDALPAPIARGTGMPGDGGAPLQGTLLSPQQCLQLLGNTLRELDSPDTGFMLGQHMLPGADPALSGALRQAASLGQALAILCEWPSFLSPLLRPRLHVGDGQAVLYWSDSHGAPGLRAALVEMHMTAVVSLARWLGGRRLPWRFCFNRARPRHIEQHEVHLGGDLRFDCQLDAMLLDAALLSQPWPGGNADACAAGLAAAGGRGRAPSLADALYDYLLAEVRCAPTLESASAAFGVSPATLKRHLARYGTHFVAELDQVRTHVALYLFQSRRADNEAVADYLGFHDAANFRRSFKRWTGLTPALLRASLAG
ncbi:MULTISPECIES: AraC family transcriptional regulator [unclassified Duganella]|uniref:AraC family transcriptional regulator n=1 Tax=unclassified Duganella TaxID=2636909 RepID=UPI0006F596C9|nr:MULTISPECIES: AraC family transcriptional regulator [unclassified Duganella]KQV61393.1 AraC family transcriptional regulator [Duganella sp. Root336D2]KRB92516.1 AraC family transcriptional regulator [Duganella sp. Root198D2]